MFYLFVAILIETQVKFDYNYITSDTDLQGSWPIIGDHDQRFKRLFLNSLKFTNSKDEENEKYSFYYNKTKLPERFSFSQDFWGYFNGKKNKSLIPDMEHITGSNIVEIGNSDRKIDENYVKAGILNKIIYPTGGSKEFKYESNRTYSEEKKFNFSINYKRVRIFNFGLTKSEAKKTSNPFSVKKDSPLPGYVSYAIGLYSNDYDPSYCFENVGNNDCPLIKLLKKDGSIDRILKGHKGNIMLNPDEEYRISVEYIPLNGPLEIDINLYGIELEDLADKNPKVGGLRIKSITAKDSDGSQILKKKYKYHLFSDKTISSGVVLNPPTFIFLNLPFYCKINNSLGSISYIQSESLFPLMGNSISIGYRNITEEEIGIDKNLKTKYTYSFSYNFNSDNKTNNFSADYFPLVPDQDVSWRRGNLLKKEYIDTSEKTIYEYDYI